MANGIVKPLTPNLLKVSELVSKLVILTNKLTK